MIDSKRRILLKGSLATGVVGVAVGAGLLCAPYALERRAAEKLTASGFKLLTKPLGPVWLTEWAKQHELPVLETVCAASSTLAWIGCFAI